MRIKDKIRSLLVDTPIYAGWAAMQRRQQQREFDSLLAEVRRADGRAKSLAGELAVRAVHRRALSDRPRVVAVGHQAWEQYGLWPTFGRMSDFHLIPLNLVGGTWSEHLRAEAGQHILAKISQLDQERPVEMVFIYADSAFLAPDMLRELANRGIWTVLMGLDDKHKYSPGEKYGMLSGQALVAPLVDVYWTTWKAAVPLFWGIGARPLYLAEGADPAFHRPMELERDIDVLFLGARYGVRGKLVLFLREQGYNVAAFGNGWPDGYVSFDKSIELINRSRVVLGVGGVGHLEHVQHLKGRDFEVPMCGAVYLTSYNPELADWYSIGEEILCYSSPQNCAETLEWILRDEAMQDKIRKAALRGSLSHHTWGGRLNTLFGLLGAE